MKGKRDFEEGGSTVTRFWNSNFGDRLGVRFKNSECGCSKLLIYPFNQMSVEALLER